MSEARPAPAGPPLREGMARASLILGILALPTVGCLGVGALAAIVLGLVAFTRANRDPQEYGGKGLAVAGIATGAASILVAPFFLGIIAAIAIPSFLRARVSANEAATMADIRAVIQAEAELQKLNDGYFGPPRCLLAPSQCVPSHSGPPLVDPAVMPGSASGSGPRPARNGYVRAFHLGPPASGGPVPDGRLMAVAYTAVPEKVGQSGVRGFCGDTTGRICFTTDGSEPEVTDGVCDPGCRDR